MSRPKKPDLQTLIGRTITAVHQAYAPKEPCREGTWHVECITLDDGTELAFYVCEREVDYLVNITHRKGVRR